MTLAVYELDRSRFDVAEPLFESGWFDRPYIDAVFEGRNTGRIFVDDVTRPTAALLARTYEFYVAGDLECVALRRFMAERPPEPGAFHLLYGYCPLDEAWVQRLIDDSGGVLSVVDRQPFTYPLDHAPPTAGIDLPDGSRLIQMDRALAELTDRHLDEHIGVVWDGYDRFAADGFGFCVVLGDEVLAAAFAGEVSRKYVDIWVSTDARYRRRGLMILAASAAIEYALQCGLAVTWDSDRTNMASLSGARKLGFVPGMPFWELDPPERPWVGEAGHWRQVDAAGEEGVRAWHHG